MNIEHFAEGTALVVLVAMYMAWNSDAKRTYAWLGFAAFVIVAAIFVAMFSGLVQSVT